MENNTYNLRQAARELNLEEHMVRQVALEFAESRRLYLDPIVQAITDHNPEEAARRAHRLKGAALELRIHHIARLAAQLEECAGQQNNTPANALITRLKDSFDILEQKLRDGV